MSARRATLLAAGLVSLACSEVSLQAASPELPLWKHRPSGSLGVVYSRSMVDELSRSGEPYEVGQPELDVAGRRLFVGSSDGGLYALRAATGGTLWRFQTLSFVQSAPLYDPAQDVVYFGSNDGALYKVAARDGALLWRFMTNAEVSQRPVLSGGVLFAVNANDTVLALDARTGKLLWSQHRTPAYGMEIAAHSGVLVWLGRVYVGFSDGTAIAYDAHTGEERWPAVDLTTEAEDASLGDLPPFLDADATPVALELESGPAVAVGSYAGGLVALDAETGQQVWSNPAVQGLTSLTLWQEPARPATSDQPAQPASRTLIAATGTSGLWGLDPESGEVRWQRRLPGSGVTAPTALQGALLLGASQLGLFLVSPRDGGVIDGLHTGDGVSMRPVSYGQRAFVVTNHGKLLSLSVQGPR